MRTVKMELFGEEHTLCFSTRVVLDAEERYGSLEKFFSALDGRAVSESDTEASGVPHTTTLLRTTIWALHAMIEAGARYERMDGANAPEVPSEDELLDRLDLRDLRVVQRRLLDAVRAGSIREQEATAPKNAEATPPEE